VDIEISGVVEKGFFAALRMTTAPTNKPLPNEQMNQQSKRLSHFFIT